MDPAIHVSVLPQTPLPSRLPHDTEQSSPFAARVYLVHSTLGTIPGLYLLDVVFPAASQLCLPILSNSSWGEGPEITHTHTPH